MATKQYLDQLVIALKANDRIAVGTIGASVAYLYGREAWARLFKQANNQVNAQPYNFVDLDTKVFNDNTEE